MIFFRERERNGWILRKTDSIAPGTHWTAVEADSGASVIEGVSRIN